jgi:hypothetical protein
MLEHPELRDCQAAADGDAGSRETDRVDRRPVAGLTSSNVMMLQPPFFWLSTAVPYRGDQQHNAARAAYNRPAALGSHQAPEILPSVVSSARHLLKFK